MRVRKNPLAEVGERVWCDREFVFRQSTPTAPPVQEVMVIVVKEYMPNGVTAPKERCWIVIAGMSFDWFIILIRPGAIAALAKLPV